MAEAGKFIPFHQRFNIDVDIDLVRTKFINRATNNVFDNLRDALSPEDYRTVKRAVASSFGVRYDADNPIERYVAGNFTRCLQALEAIYEVPLDAQYQYAISSEISELLRRSEVDVGVSWQPPMFIRTGAPMLDEHLVNEPLRWLAEPRYKSVRQPFEKGLSHYLESQSRPDRLADVITDMYEAVEALAKIVTGRSGKDLSANTERFVSEIDASQHYKTMLRNYIRYGNEFRHAEQQGRLRPALSEPEVESFIYLTGLFIRLAIRTT